MKEEGADIVIALSHSGIDIKPGEDAWRTPRFYLAGVEGIDAVFTGHQHLVFPGPKTWDGWPASIPSRARCRASRP
jgi:2',3'-cyclic-nucleotide 2'-phosphodiesterase/3'-nucleotidase